VDILSTLVMVMVDMLPTMVLAATQAAEEMEQ
jgi:hypothetical protein